MRIIVSTQSSGWIFINNDPRRGKSGGDCKSNERVGFPSLYVCTSFDSGPQTATLAVHTPTAFLGVVVI